MRVLQIIASVIQINCAIGFLVVHPSRGGELIVFGRNMLVPMMLLFSGTCLVMSFLYAIGVNADPTLTLINSIGAAFGVFVIGFQILRWNGPQIRAAFRRPNR